MPERIFKFELELKFEGILWLSKNFNIQGVAFKQGLNNTQSISSICLRSQMGNTQWRSKKLDIQGVVF